jgi:hypothetical protein
MAFHGPYPGQTGTTCSPPFPPPSRTLLPDRTAARTYGQMHSALSVSEYILVTLCYQDCYVKFVHMTKHELDTSWYRVRVGSLNNVPSQVRTTVVPDVPTARRWDVRRFWAVWINFGRFQRRYAPKTHLDSRFQARYGTLFKECTRTSRTKGCTRTRQGRRSKAVERR